MSVDLLLKYAKHSHYIIVGTCVDEGYRMYITDCLQSKTEI